MLDFLRDLVRIPSYDSQIGAVGEACASRMRQLGFDEVRFDSMGNVLGRIGNGSRTLLFDSHIDTVGIGDRNEWQWDPLEGKEENGVIYGRGACDEKGSTPPMIYAMAALKELDLVGDWTLYYFGNMEEWCDGIACQALVEHEGVRPDFVVIGEPTRMNIYRGHRGRIEISATFKGRVRTPPCRVWATIRSTAPRPLSRVWSECWIPCRTTLCGAGHRRGHQCDSQFTLLERRTGRGGGLS
jgi:putative selenium metabolism hydrolase